MVSQLFPGETADSSYTIQSFLMPEAPGPEHDAIIAKQKGFLMHVVRDQDYHTGLGIQQAVKTGAKDHFVYGRNELGGQRFHQWVGDLVAAEDEPSYLDLLARSEISFQS